MTRYLSQALGAVEPAFSLELAQLERAGGHPNADIRLSTEVAQRLREKVAELGLDPTDTTGPELYSALQERLRADETRVRAALGLVEEAAADEVIASIQKYVDASTEGKQCFALKTSVAKRLLKKKPPKLAMKHLGYRSLDSLLKHEPVASIYAATQLFESPQWHKAFRAQYAKLQPNDFEQRAMQLVRPSSARWHEASVVYVQTARQNLLCYRELGAIVLLPLEATIDGLAITTLILTLNTMNEIRAHSSFLKLQQVKPNFGAIVEQTATEEPYVQAQLVERPIAWRTIHHFFARFQEHVHPEVFEPHVQPEDLTWHAPEDLLAQLEPTLEFWQNTQFVCMLHDGQPVSCNIFDVALSYCNHLSFEERAVHFVRDNLWRELTVRYLHQENLEQAVLGELGRELAPELVEE